MDYYTNMEKEVIQMVEVKIEPVASGGVETNGCKTTN